MQTRTTSFWRGSVQTDCYQRRRHVTHHPVASNRRISGTPCQALRNKHMCTHHQRCTHMQSCESKVHEGECFHSWRETVEWTWLICLCWFTCLSHREITRDVPRGSASHRHVGLFSKSVLTLCSPHSVDCFHCLSCLFFPSLWIHNFLLGAHFGIEFPKYKKCMSIL